MSTLTKPLGIKNYGSIPHLPGSRMGPGDHKIHEGQERICTVKCRDRHDKIIVQEKLDGSNVGVAKIDNRIVALSRSGFPARTSLYEQHRRFAEWVADNEGRFDSLLQEGERVVGEWLLQAHGTRYCLIHEPFVAFDIMAGTKRVTFEEFARRLEGVFPAPYLVHIGGPLSIADAMRLLGERGKHGALDPIEGAVWRVERHGEVEFLAKYVRPDKVDGKYLESVTGGVPVWNAQAPAPSCPHASTHRDASGAIVCDDCGEEITRG